VPYFPKKRANHYKCRGCGDWFTPGNVSCCVAHAPGTCCHYGETRIEEEPNARGTGEAELADMGERRGEMVDGFVCRTGAGRGAQETNDQPAVASDPVEVDTWEKLEAEMLGVAPLMHQVRKETVRDWAARITALREKDRIEYGNEWQIADEALEALAAMTAERDEALDKLAATKDACDKCCDGYKQLEAERDRLKAAVEQVEKEMRSGNLKTYTHQSRRIAWAEALRKAREGTT
jgi:hypothetical protein